MGPLLLGRLRRWLHTRDSPLPVTLIEAFQFQPEHALDLCGHRLALFIDAAASGPVPYEFSPVTPHRDASYSSHAMSPAAVLHAYVQTMGPSPPAAWLLKVRGERFGLGEPVSPAVMERLAAAEQWVRDLCLRPEIEYWRCRGPSTRSGTPS